MHWSYCSLALSHWYMFSRTVSILWYSCIMRSSSIGWNSRKFHQEVNLVWWVCTQPTRPSQLTAQLDSFTVSFNSLNDGPGCARRLSVAFEKWWKFPLVMWAQNALQLRHPQHKLRLANHKRVMPVKSVHFLVSDHTDILQPPGCDCVAVYISADGIRTLFTNSLDSQVKSWENYFCYI